MHGTSRTQLMTSPMTCAANCAAGTMARTGRPPHSEPTCGACCCKDVVAAAVAVTAWNVGAGLKASGSSSMDVQRPRRSTHT